MELNTTAASPAANAYVTVPVATDILFGRLHTEPWFDPPDAILRNTSALIWATRLLDEQVNWHGTPLTRTQALAWPMTGQIDRYGRVVDQTIIPLVIQQATALYALALLRDSSEDAGRQEEAYLGSLKVGDTALTFRTQGLPPVASRMIPAEIRSILRPYGIMTGGVNVPLLRV